MPNNGISIKKPDSHAEAVMILDEKEYKVTEADLPHSIFTILPIGSITTKQGVKIPENGEFSFHTHIKISENGDFTVKLTRI
ncbi:MAG: hypothetical protein KA198_07065 [Chitinophagaceae bacterium]|nr:hypothetical protein [Chitinophagaceae bacterium]